MAREMKDSGIKWVGIIPENWSVLRIKYLANDETDSFQDGDWIESPYITDSGIRYLTTGNVGDGVFKRQGNGYITEETFIELNCKYAYPNDLVISRLNAPYGRACILPEDEDKYILAVDIVILRTNHDKQFLCYLMQCKGYQEMVQDGAKGTTMKRISRTNLGNLSLPIAPLGEQHRIAQFLDRRCAEIDSAIADTQRTIEEYKKLKQSIITEAVTRGVCSERPMKEGEIAWLDVIPAEWDVVRLKSMFGFGKGLPITKDNLAETGISVISYGQIHSKMTSGVELQQHLFRYVDEAYLDTNPQSLVHQGDFIFADTSEDFDGCGNAVYVDKEMTLFAGYHTIILNSKTGADNKYIAYQFQTDLWRSQIRSRVSGVKVFSVSRKILGDATIILPPATEREKIVAYLDEKCDAIDRIIAAKQQLIEEMEVYKKSVIYEYVTGKKEVPACQ